MEQTLLTPAQQTVLRLVSQEPALSGYSLSGGTALSVFYLHHRISDDLDFFSQVAVDRMNLDAFIVRLKEAVRARTVEPQLIHDRRLFLFRLPVGELKVEFTLYPFPSLEDPTPHNGVRVDSLRDISAGKLMALLDRFEPKDFVDLYFLLQERPLEEIKHDAEKKFGITISPIQLGGELSKVGRVEALPKMLKPLTIEELKTFFSQQAQSLKPSLFDE